MKEDPNQASEVGQEEVICRAEPFRRSMLRAGTAAEQSQPSELREMRGQRRHAGGTMTASCALPRWSDFIHRVHKVCCVLFFNLITDVFKHIQM